MPDPPPPSPPFPESLCHRCGACRHVRTRTSVFVLCEAMAVKYPRQPVVACPLFRPRGDEKKG